MREVEEIGELDFGGRPVAGAEATSEQQPREAAYDGVRQQILLQRSQHQAHSSDVGSMHDRTHNAAVRRRHCRRIPSERVERSEFLSLRVI